MKFASIVKNVQSWLCIVFDSVGI